MKKLIFFILIGYLFAVAQCDNTDVLPTSSSRKRGYPTRDDHMSCPYDNSNCCSCYRRSKCRRICINCLAVMENNEAKQQKDKSSAAQDPPEYTDTKSESNFTTAKTLAFVFISLLIITLSFLIVALLRICKLNSKLEEWENGERERSEIAEEPPVPTQNLNPPIEEEPQNVPNPLYHQI